MVIIALLLAMALPSFTSTWQERKLAQTLTILHGVLTSTRAKALNTSERGLFFYIDPLTRRQMIMPIVADPPNSDQASHEYSIDCGLTEAPDLPDPITDCITDLMAEHRFRPVEGEVYELPVPIRVAPRNIVDSARWPESDIAHDHFNQVSESDWPRHRNFFTVLFGADGKLIVGRDVLIHDVALRKPGSLDHFAVRTGYYTKLRVDDPTHYYVHDENTRKKLDPGDKTLYDMIVEMDASDQPVPNAINFTSVDGLLVYDESVLADMPYEDGQTFKGEYLLGQGRPLYIDRLSGAVLQGPIGENE